MWINLQLKTVPQNYDISTCLSKLQCAAVLITEQLLKNDTMSLFGSHVKKIYILKLRILRIFIRNEWTWG